MIYIHVFIHKIKIIMPFHSRHSSDGRHRLWADVPDEEEYDQFKNKIVGSNFAHEIPSHSDSSDADVFPPSSSEEEKIDKTRKWPKRIPSKILQIEAAATIHVQNLWKNSFRQL